MPVQRYAVVGGGIIGTAVARRLLAQRPDAVRPIFSGGCCAQAASGKAARPATG